MDDGNHVMIDTLGFILSFTVMYFLRSYSSSSEPELSEDELLLENISNIMHGLEELTLKRWWWNTPWLPDYRFGGGGQLVSSSSCLDDLIAQISKSYSSLSPADRHLVFGIILNRLPLKSIIRFKSNSSSLPPHLLDILFCIPVTSMIRLKYKPSSHLLLDIMCRLPFKSIIKARSSSPTSLPPDLVLDILCRLPVKSIIRFKCVSKSWNTVLTDRLFANMQFDKTSKSSLSRDCFICMDNNRQISFMIVYPHDPSFLGGEIWRKICVNQIIMQSAKSRIVVGSSKGWVCISDEPYFQNFIIANPAIRLVLRVPYRDPWESMHMHGVKVTAGFGYDECHDDLKLLRIEQPHDTSNLSFSKIEIYSLRSRSWKFISSSENIEPTSYIPVAMLGSRLYWKSSARDDNYTVRIAIFDLCSETFYASNPIGRPLEEGITKSRLDVLALREESLALIYYDYDLGDISMSIMSLDDLTFKQVEMTCLDVPPYSADKCLEWLRVHHGRIIAIQNNGDLMVQCCERGWFGNPAFDVRLFSLNKNNFVNIVNYGNIINPSHVWWSFRESLIC